MLFYKPIKLIYFYEFSMTQDIRTRVKEAATDKFVKYGYRKVTTDEIAKEAGISKRTLYEHFLSKEDIAKSMVIDEMNCIKDKIESICNNPELNIIQKLISLYNIPRKISDRSNFELFKDFRNEIPEIIEIMNKYETVINRYVSDLFTKGQDEGFLRKDIDPILILRLARIFKDKMTENEFKALGNYSKDEIMKTFHKLFIQGILSRKVLENHYEEIESLLEEV